MTTIDINGQPVPATRIDELDPTINPARDHVVPAMRDGITVKLSIDQILGILEGRLNGAGIARASATVIDDWNDAKTSGWYMSSTAANQPTENVWYIGTVVPHNELYVTQTVIEFVGASSTDTRTYRRHCFGGSWGAWYKLSLSQAEQDARYLRRAGGEMAPGAIVKFADEAGTKIQYYGTNFGTAVEPGALTTWAFGRHRWRMDALDGPVVAELTSAGFELSAAPTLPNHAATKAYVDGLGLGSVLAYQDVMTGTASTTSTSFTDTGLEISGITLPSANHGLLLSAPVALGASTSGMSVALVFTDGANNVLAQADAAGSRSTGGLGRSASANFETGSVFGGLDQFAWYPGSAGPHTVKLRWKVSNGTGYLNRSGNDNDAASNIRLASGLTALVLAPQA